MKDNITIPKGKMLVEHIESSKYYNEEGKFRMRDIKDVKYDVGKIVAVARDVETPLIGSTVFYISTFVLHIKEDDKINQYLLIGVDDCLLFINE